MVVERRARHAAFRQYQLLDRHVHVPRQRCRRPAAHSAHRAGHRRDERKSADRQKWRCDRHRQRRQYRQLRHRGHRTQGWDQAGQHQTAVGQEQCRDRRRCASRAPLWSISPSESICWKALQGGAADRQVADVELLGARPPEEIHEVCSRTPRTISRTWPKSIERRGGHHQRESRAEARSSRAGAFQRLDSKAMPLCSSRAMSTASSPTARAVSDRDECQEQSTSAFLDADKSPPRASRPPENPVRRSRRRPG